MTNQTISQKVFLLLGVGQDAIVARWVTRKAPWISDAIEPVNYLSFPDHKIAMTKAEQYMRERGKEFGKNDVLIAESQAAPLIVTMLLNEKLVMPKMLILLEPLGCNHASLGATRDERYRSLMHRSRLFWRHPNQSLSVWGNRRTLKNIITASLPNITRIKSMYTWGANQNSIEDLKILANKTDVHIVAATQDSLFPYDEIAKEINQYPSINLHRIDGTHLNRGTKAGIEQLELVRDLLL